MTNTKQPQTNTTLPPSNNYNRFRTPYGPKLKQSITFQGPGKTKQSFKDECDINTIMARYQVSGLIDHFNPSQPQYLDCTGADYQLAMQTVASAMSMFQELPSSVRSRFENDPAKFLDFAQNPENLPEMAEMGLARPDYKKEGGSTTQPAATQPSGEITNPQASTTPNPAT